MKENEYETNDVWQKIKSNEMEFLDEIATQITEMKFGDETMMYEEQEFSSGNEMRFTDEAQDFYNERYDEIETLYIRLILQTPKKI